ncbi:MAG TPA: LuxR C-terminal-related transcriptional regulator [Anaerolineaceae bacterium]|mgnify:CR=1 FL=1|nr:LuxR C-terminal-related transcriptional regulator [Anaerolineaceae bacterium]HPN50249.1 LuxR C-terminal-related transcriptional regulator [Anaerolineaceae bacterium]
MNSLPQTKFSPPYSRRDLLPRPDLMDWLRQELPANRLVLVSAPAGYGKTTLLSSIPEVLPDYKLAWLGLDAEDNDPPRFLAGLAEALGRVDERLKIILDEQTAATIGLLSGESGSLALRQAVVALINAEEQFSLPLVVVLDDLHEVTTPAITEALDYWVEHMPARMHLVIATRHEPPLHLGRFRARRLMAELDMSGLRFDLAESQQFLNGLLGLNLSEAAIAEIHTRTEGWPVGVVLLTEKLRRTPGRDLSGVLTGTQVDGTTFGYLADEVLAQQPEPLRDFLLETCILDELTPSLCRSISGRDNAGWLLEEVQNRNLFLVQVGASQGEAVYRYHALFAGFLRQVLSQKKPELWKKLHRAAAAGEKSPEQAVQHWLAAQAWEEAAAVIESTGPGMLENGRHQTVMQWISALPEALVNQRARLLCLSGLANLLRGEMEAARRQFTSSLRQVEPSDHTTRGQVLVSLASLAFIQAEFQACAEWVRQAEPFVGGLHEEVDFLMLRASLALFWEGAWEQARQDLLAAMDRVRQTEQPRLWFRFSLYLGPEFSILPGVLEVLEDFCQEAHRRFGSLVSPLRLGIEDTWAGLALRRGNLKRAMELGQDALWVKAQLGGYTFLGLNAALAVTAASSGLGNFTRAEETMSLTLEQVQEAELNHSLAGGGLYPLGRLAWLQGRYEEARLVQQEMASLENPLAMTDVLRHMLAGLCRLADGAHRQAERELLEAARLQRQELVSEIYGSARLLLAVVYERWNNSREALAQLDMVMARCEQTQTWGVILQEMPLVAPLLRLAVQQGMRGQQAAGLLEQMGLTVEGGAEQNTLLTARQLEILRLMAAGYSNQAVADALVLSLATVKSHVVHIMNRLGVSSRMEAVARARELRLL